MGRESTEGEGGGSDALIWLWAHHYEPEALLISMPNTALNRWPRIFVLNLHVDVAIRFGLPEIKRMNDGFGSHRK